MSPTTLSRKVAKHPVRAAALRGQSFGADCRPGLTVPVAIGTVTMPGETIATVAEKNFVLRLRVPERHARFLKEGDTVRVDSEALGANGATVGTSNWCPRRSRTAA